MEIRQLKYFVSIVNSGSLSRAAQTSFVAQSALSKQISDLENELDTLLLERSRSGIKPTEEGKIFYQYSLAILKQIEDAKLAVKSSSKHIVGNVSLAIPQSISLALALPLSVAAKQTHPGICLNLNEELTGNLIDQLQQGRIDFTILTSNNPLSAFRVWDLAREELCLIAPAAAPVKHRNGYVTYEYLSNIPLVLSSRDHDHCMRAIVEQSVRANGFSVGEVVSEINSVTIIKSAVMSGIGYTIFPRSLVAHELANGLMSAYPIGPTGLYRELVLCASKSIPLTNPKRAVIRLILTVIKNLCESQQWLDGTYTGQDPANLQID